MALGIERFGSIEKVFSGGANELLKWQRTILLVQQSAARADDDELTLRAGERDVYTVW
jgi:hypothetical protein